MAVPALPTKIGTSFADMLLRSPIVTLVVQRARDLEADRPQRFERVARVIRVEAVRDGGRARRPSPRAAARGRSTTCTVAR